MSQLEQYRTNDLIGIGKRQMPGSWVRHRNNKKSFGVLIARVDTGSFSGDRALVLWSQAPVARISSSHAGRWDDL